MSTKTTVELYKGDTHRTLTLRYTDVVTRANAGERRAQTTLDRVGTHLGIGIANVIASSQLTDVTERNVGDG